MNKVKSTDLIKLPHRHQVYFAVFCARQAVEYLSKEEKKELSLKAIKIVELWLDHEATEEECYKVGHAVVRNNITNTNTINAAYATAHATYATNIINAPYASALAASYAAFTYDIISEQWKYYDNLLNLDKYAEEMLSDGDSTR